MSCRKHVDGITVCWFAEALHSFSATLGLTPEDWRGHVLLGVTLSRMDDLESALREMKIAARLAPGKAEVRCNMANILEQMGKNGCGGKGVPGNLQQKNSVR